MVLDCLRVVVDVFEVVVEFFEVVVGGFRSFHVLVTTFDVISKYDSPLLYENVIVKKILITFKES